MKSIFLVGFMGAGKTTVGSILSEKMNEKKQIQIEQNKIGFIVSK